VWLNYKLMKVSFYEAVATLVGCTIGAGILGIPYVFAKAGVVTGIIVLAVIASIMLYLNLGFGEVVLRTKKKYQVTGYAEKYLGKKAKLIMMVSALIIFYLIMAAYILAAGKVFAQLLGISEIFGSIIFFLIFAVTLSFGLKFIEESELGASLVILILIIFLIILLAPKMSITNINVFSAKNLLVPYGILMFAFYGLAAIPEMGEELEKNKKNLKKAILTGTISIGVIYALFAIAAVGVMGMGTTEVAVLGLTMVIGPAIFLIGGLFALFALFTSALPISLATKEIFNYDLNVSNKISFLLATLIPLGLFFAIKEFASFSIILNIVGAIFCTIQLVLVLFMIESAKKKGDRKPEYSVYISRPLIYFIIALVVIGAVNVLI